MGAGWLSLLPARLMRFPPDGWSRAALGRAQRLRGVVMVADVCGFTAMSEAVGRSGPGATERLSRTINDVFAPVVDMVHEHGGEVALFVGDAVVAVFPGGAEARACAAAVHRPGPLELSVGLAAGTLTSTVVGDPRGRLEHVLFGEALTRAARAERRAGPGRTVAERLGAGAGPPLRPVAPPDPRAAVAPFVHPSVAARLEAGRERLLAEHRRVTALFCRFEDLRADDLAAPARLQAVVTAALDVLVRFDGALLQVELVDKGSTLKAAFGAPVAHEDDERRATACARALHERPELAGAAIGIASGSVYCGLIGSAARREYTVLGDTMNIAARLMLAAGPGRTLAADTTRAHAGDWGWTAAGPLGLRGRTGAVTAFAPTRGLRSAGAPAARRPFAGRERELKAALERLEAALAGEGSVLTITGEPGIGKSRLLDELVAVARRQHLTVLRGGGEPFGRDFAYGAWRSPARELFGDDPSPLLAPLLGRPAGDSELPPDLRVEALHGLVVERVARRAPLLLAFEDGQWLDAPSLALLRRVSRALPALPVLVALTARSGEARGLPHGTTLALDGLSAEALADLVPGPPEAVAAIVARAGGNPLFAEELVSLRRARAGAALPHTLRAVVGARLDMLSEGERAAVRIASVIGTRFAPAWLWGSDPGLGGADAVRRTLARLARLDIVRRDGALHAFKHAVTRDVAYETLALAAREHLHESVARHVERSHDLESLEALELLAHHYSHTGNTGKQRVYLRRAGDAARAAFANDAAIRHYRDLVALLSGHEALDATLDLAAVLQLTGGWAEAEALYREALARAGDEHAAARARAALGGLLGFTGAYPDAVARLEEARASFAALGDRRELLRVLERLAHTYFQQGDNAAATARAREQVELARELGDRASESTAMNTLGLVLWHRGELEPARERLEAALALAREAEHRIGVVHLLNDLAGVLVALGRSGEAIARLGEASTHARAIGYRRFEGAVVGNAAQMLLDAGDDAPALACAGMSMEIAASLGDVLPVLHNAIVIAAICRRRGDARAAESLLERVAAAARAADNRRYLAEARLHQARARLDLGRPAAAEHAAAEAEAIARAIGQTPIAAEAAALLAGVPAGPPPAGPKLDATPFIGAGGAPPDAETLVRSAERALDALNPSNDVVAVAGGA